MKKNIIVLLAATLLAACSQESSDIVQKEPDGNISGITMTADNFVIDAQTRTTLTPTTDGMEFSWADKDTVGIYPDRGDQVCFPISTGTDSNTASFDGGGWALKASSKYAAYYPFNRANYFQNNGTILLKYKGQKQTADASTTHLSMYDFMAAGAVVPNDGNVTFAFKHMNSVLQLKLKVPKAAILSSLTLTTNENLLAEEAALNLKSDPVLLTGTKVVKTLTLDLENITTTADNQEVTFYMMIAPVDLTGKELSAALLDNNGNSYSAALTPKSFEAGKAYSFSATAVVSDATTDVTLSLAGTLLAAIGGYDNLRNIKKLKIAGEINGDDVYEIRRMDNLEYLNLKDCKIVAGGKAYCDGFTTSDNVIGNSMFRECTAIKQLLLPENIVALGNNSFTECRSLASISIPEGIERIEAGTFSYCTNLTSVSIPVSIKSIGQFSFTNCYLLPEIVIPINVESIGESAFNNCSKLREIHIKAQPTTLTTIGANAFNGSYDKATLYIPKGTKATYQQAELGRFTTIIEE